MLWNKSRVEKSVFFSITIHIIYLFTIFDFGRCLSYLPVSFYTFRCLGGNPIDGVFVINKIDSFKDDLTLSVWNDGKCFHLAVFRYTVC